MTTSRKTGHEEAVVLWTLQVCRQNALISLTKYHAWPDGEIEMTQSRWVETQTGRHTDA